MTGTILTYFELCLNLEYLTKGCTFFIKLFKNIVSDWKLTMSATTTDLLAEFIPTNRPGRLVNICSNNYNDYSDFSPVPI